MCVCVCVCNDLGDPPGHLTLPPVATYADEASPCAIWPVTTAWIVKLSPPQKHTQTQISAQTFTLVILSIHSYKVYSHKTNTQTTVKSNKGQTGRGQIDLSSMLKNLLGSVSRKQRASAVEMFVLVRLVILSCKH